jgi:hypothetical protein
MYIIMDWSIFVEEIYMYLCSKNWKYIPNFFYNEF